MKRIIILMTTMIIVLGLSTFAYALLQDNGDGTVTQVRNDGSVLMWLKDVNAAQTMGYDLDGLMDWSQANAWIDHLNNSNYLGYNNWRLPILLPVDGVSYNISWSYDGSTDRGFNNAGLNSELGYMFYTELGNLGNCDIGGNCPQPGWGLTNTGPFINVQDAGYWFGQEYDSNEAWSFAFGRDGGLGSQEKLPKDAYYWMSAWAVRDVESSDEKSAVDYKNDAITELKALKNGDKKTDKKISKAIKYINKSLRAKYWMDEIHLDPKRGYKVFKYELKAVDYLVEILEEDDDTNFNYTVADVIQTVINKLINADMILAETAIDDAINTFVVNPKYQNKVDKYIAKAEAKLAKADDKLSEGELYEAIYFEGKAWKYAQKAMTYANKTDD